MLSTAFLALPPWGLPVIIAAACVGAVAAAGAIACTVLLIKTKRRTQNSSAEDGELAPQVEEKAQPAPEKASAKAEEIPAPAESAEPAKVTAKAPKVPARAASAGKTYVLVRYNRSFEAKLIQSDDILKNYYQEIKNELTRYKLTDRVSWKHETFRKGRKLLVKLAIRGKSLYAYYALDPAVYLNTKYKIRDVSASVSNAAVPTLYIIKNDRRCKYAKKLIADVAAENGLEAGEEQREDYAARYPYEEIEPLIERGLVKLVPLAERDKDAETGEIAVPEGGVTGEIAAAMTAAAGEHVGVTVEEAEEMIPDEDVEKYVAESADYSDRSKKTVINVDTLGKYFGDGETVTVEEIKKRVPDTDGKATYVKVLARGSLDKALIVEADDFSPAAVKMIALTGGKVIRKKRK